MQIQVQVPNASANTSTIQVHVQAQVPSASVRTSTMQLQVQVQVSMQVPSASTSTIYIGCEYRHPTMDANEFDVYFLNSLNEKRLLNRNKEIILMGDFNINLLRYNEDHKSTNFLDQIYSCSFIPHIASPKILYFQLKEQNQNLKQILTVVTLKRFDHIVFLQDLQTQQTALKLTALNVLYVCMYVCR